MLHSKKISALSNLRPWWRWYYHHVCPPQNIGETMRPLTSPGNCWWPSYGSSLRGWENFKIWEYGMFWGTQILHLGGKLIIVPWLNQYHWLETTPLTQGRFTKAHRCRWKLTKHVICVIFHHGRVLNIKPPLYPEHQQSPPSIIGHLWLAIWSNNHDWIFLPRIYMILNPKYNPILITHEK